MPTDMGPSHDRVRLTPNERRAIANLEESLAASERLPVRLWWRVRDVSLLLCRRFLLLAPWLVPPALVATVICFTVSAIAGALSALVTSVLVLLSLWRAAIAVVRRQAVRDGLPPPPRR